MPGSQSAKKTAMSHSCCSRGVGAGRGVMPQIIEIVAGGQLARSGAAGASLAVVDVPVGPCAQTPGPGLTPAIRARRGGGSLGSLTPAHDGAAGGTCSARRRRERRQRWWWRHEHLSVATALTSGGPAVVTRSSRQEVEHETYDGLRALKLPPPGTRLGVLQDPGPPWVEAVTVGYVAAGPLVGFAGG